MPLTGTTGGMPSAPGRAFLPLIPASTAQAICAGERPELREIALGVSAACHFAERLTLDHVAKHR